MTNNSNPEVDEVNTRDPHKASWQHEAELEPDGDETAGVVIVESETIAMAYALHRKSRLRDNPELTEEDLANWTEIVAAQITRRFNLYLQVNAGTGMMGEHSVIFDSHPLGRLMFMNIMSDLMEGCECSDLYWEDVIGISIIGTTTKVQLHFSLEGIENGGSTAQSCAQH